MGKTDLVKDVADLLERERIKRKELCDMIKELSDELHWYRSHYAPFYCKETKEEEKDEEDHF